MMVSILIMMSRGRRALHTFFAKFIANFKLYSFLQFQSGWSIPVELVIGSEVGIAYTTDSAITVSNHY